MGALIPDPEIVGPYAIDWNFGPLPQSGERAVVFVPGYFIGIVVRGANADGVLRWTGLHGEVCSEGIWWAFKLDEEWSPWQEMNAWWHVIG